MTHLSEAMLIKMVRAGATVIIPGNLGKRPRRTKSLKQSFSDELRSRRKVLPINIGVIPVPKPG